MIQEWLKKSESIPRKHGLYRMEAILSALGNPERELKSIHIAGTTLHHIWTVLGNGFS